MRGRARHKFAVNPNYIGRLNYWFIINGRITLVLLKLHFFFGAT